jgi:hypothetical protein
MVHNIFLFSFFSPDIRPHRQAVQVEEVKEILGITIRLLGTNPATSHAIKTADTAPKRVAGKS